ncbi:thiaminase II [Actinomadura kijaniata]|uniref:Aminopyrimidine aminohydrolase n=1 Tax=Actinomadura namibiensis TaxID=182080 RepID=A0A7W3QQN4_ACTNM|nr:thiaminase II [Actinomadura namibiensis]MBA8955468.1 thiaminase/transcriptional activator TenA [Actinomadura namibiensis]
MGFTSELWESGAATYERIRVHPFVQGLTSGDLDRAAFRHYIAQDSHYLREYARALNVVAAKAPTPEGTALFGEHATNANAVERALHAGFLDELGGVDQPASPTTVAYTNFLLATAHTGSFAEGLAAVLPCYWIYARVGADLVDRSSPDPLYARWIATYGGDGFQKIVDDVLTVTDRHAEGLGPAERAAMLHHYATAARYEWMFWDAAHRRETWPIPLA